MLPKFFLVFIINFFSIIDKFGYLGLFFVSLLLNAFLIFIPSPLSVIVFAVSAKLNPLIVAIVVSVASSIGSTTKYLIGLGGKEILQGKYEREMEKVRKAFEKYKFFWWIIAINLTPFPDDPVSIFCGMVKYDFKKYFLAILIGKLIFNSIVAYAGYYSINSIVDLLQINI